MLMFAAETVVVATVRCNMSFFIAAFRRNLDKIDYSNHRFMFEKRGRTLQSGRRGQQI